MTDKISFSFDVGMTSLGIAVNQNNEIIHADVLLMHEEAGSVSAQAGRRRMCRTREAHKAREAVLERLWRSIGKEPLQRKRFMKKKNAKGKRAFTKIKADERLEREFPAKGDDTVYASSLLRILLIEGQPLKDWQIYKALHAGIQRRGYDANVPWKAREEARAKEKKQATKKDENPETQVTEFSEQLNEMTSDERYHLPCYYDAWKMGLWDPQGKKIIAIRQPRRSRKPKEDRARGYNPARDLVTREIKSLLDRAAEQIPALKEHLTEDKLTQLLYGTQRDAIDKRYPSASKIDGLLGQKYPRFENRIVSKCALIPRLNVCKSEKPLAIEVGFLLRLVDWRYEREDEHGKRAPYSLTSQQINEIFKECESAWEKKKKKAQQYDPEEYAKCFKLTQGKVSKRAEKMGGNVKIGHEKIPASTHTGRSRFSQPALYLMKHLILSEKTPPELHKELSQAVVAAKKKAKPAEKFGYQIFSDDVPYKYFPDDFRFLEKMGSSRESIHVPDISLAERYINEDGDVEAGIQKIINSCNWPELRHRLNVFHRELEKLVEEYGKPGAVHLEFIREDFLSEKKKEKYIRQSDKGRDVNKQAIKELRERNIDVSDKNILRYRLYEEQNHQCLYTGESIDISKLESYDIDHIFPEGENGPDAYYNKVLTSADVNRKKKGKRLPCECHDFIDWPAFKNRLKELKLGKNKKKLLSASNRAEAEELIEKYTGLSGTAYIARLARDIVCLQFGWQPGAKGEQQRIFVFSGGLTSKVAKKYKLYQALGDGSKHYEKDRSDDRHHALDAMVISYLRQWARDKNKTEFFKFPNGINAAYFEERLADVHPRYVTRTRPALREQPDRYRRAGKNKMNVKEYKNISKDPDERGQWYTNKKDKDEGTFQHGYLFYKDKKGKVHPKTIHSFRSPYQIQKEVEKKAGEILGQFYQGKRIELTGQDKIKATQLGRATRLKFGNYLIDKVNKKEIVIEYIPKEEEESASRYRITRAMLKKIIVTNLLMVGNPFELHDFDMKEGEPLSGRYRVEQERSNHLTVVNTQDGEEKRVQLDRLVRHFIEKEPENPIRENDRVEINGNHKDYIKKVTTDDVPGQKLPGERYRIKGFSSGAKAVELISQNGTVYRVNSKILLYCK